jgi:hypothetical protein
MGTIENAYKVSVGKSEAERQLVRPRCNWVNNIKIHLREIGREDID